MGVGGSPPWHLECESGICYARTGRRFFEQVSLEREMVAAVQAVSIERTSGSAQVPTPTFAPVLVATALRRGRQDGLR